MAQRFCLIFWRLFDIWQPYFWIMSQYDPMIDLKIKYRSLWPIFHGPVILPRILKTVWTLYFRIMRQYDLTFDIKINVGHCDLYFVVQWFCLISWRLFDVWTSYFGIMSQYDTAFDLKVNVGHCDLYFLVHWIWPDLWPQNIYSDFALYLENSSVAEHHTLGLWVSMTRHLTSKYL